MSKTLKEMFDEVIGEPVTEEVLKGAECEISFKVDEEGIACKISGSVTSINAAMLSLLKNVSEELDVEFDDYLAELGAKHMFASMVHDMLNGEFKHCGKCDCSEDKGCKH